MRFDATEANCLQIVCQFVCVHIGMGVAFTSITINLKMLQMHAIVYLTQLSVD